jgi:phosphoribosylaminoimidazolecarboxamide formyltransferase/IMP cyclohydrolase
VSGKELSYNNILDLDVAYAIVQEYSDPCVVVIKHNTPCGIATDPSIITAYQKVIIISILFINYFINY